MLDMTKEPLCAAVKLIDSGEVSCAVTRGGEIIHTASGRGVSPLMRLYDGEPDKLRGSVVVDKIIGKAAATILILGGAVGVYGALMSEAAVGTLEAHGINYAYGKLVEVIRNRTGDGVCPIESSVLGEDAPEQGLENIRAAIAVLMKQS